MVFGYPVVSFDVYVAYLISIVAPYIAAPVVIHIEATVCSRLKKVYTLAVSYTHLDVYKRQAEEGVYAELRRLLDEPAAYRAMATAVNPYGDGAAVPRCAAAIEALLGVGSREPDFVADVRAARIRNVA